MSASNELEAGRWIKATLQADSDFPAYLNVIPNGVDLPAFRYQCQRRNDVRTVNQHIAMSVYHFLVVATTQGESQPETGPHGAVTLEEYITDTLHRASGQTSKARILACTRTETYTDQENVGGDSIFHAGGIFEVLVMGLPESE